MHLRGFPGSSASKESTCNAGDPGLIPGSGRSPGERIDYPPQYSWAFLVAQLVKNLLAMGETWVLSLGWEDPWRRERLPNPIFWPGEFHGLYRLSLLRIDWPMDESVECGRILRKFSSLQLRARIDGSEKWILSWTLKEKWIQCMQILILTASLFLCPFNCVQAEASCGWTRIWTNLEQITHFLFLCFLYGVWLTG